MYTTGLDTSPVPSLPYEEFYPGLVKKTIWRVIWTSVIWFVLWVTLFINGFLKNTLSPATVRELGLDVGTPFWWYCMAFLPPLAMGIFTAGMMWEWDIDKHIAWARKHWNTPDWNPRADLARRRGYALAVGKYAHLFDNSALQREIDRKARALEVHNTETVRKARQLTREYVMAAEAIIRTHDSTHPDKECELERLNDGFMRAAEEALRRR